MHTWTTQPPGIKVQKRQLFAHFWERAVLSSIRQLHQCSCSFVASVSFSATQNKHIKVSVRGISQDSATNSRLWLAQRAPPEQINCTMQIMLHLARVGAQNQLCSANHTVLGSYRSTRCLYKVTFSRSQSASCKNSFVSMTFQFFSVRAVSIHLNALGTLEKGFKVQ